MISWKNVEIKIRTTQLINHLTFSLEKGESLGIIGDNGTGKTVLAKALAGMIPVQGNINTDFSKLKTALVSFQSTLKLKNGSAAYHQQRWNNLDPELVPLVREEIQYDKYRDQLEPLLQKFDFERLLNSNIISLSNGEQHKMELMKALSQQTDLLILDNAFNGLDSGSRNLLTQLIEQLVSEKQSVVMTGLKKDDFPDSIQKFIHLRKNEIPQFSTRDEIVEESSFKSDQLLELPVWKNSNFDELIALENVNLKYGEKSILKNITWKVKAGEHWVLSGPNGSGKTSLLDLIFADNPKAYGSNIRLFGKPKGSGESIWDIKKQIGFISPELQQYLPSHQNALQVICSGFFESEGLYKKPTSYQESVAKQWLSMLGNPDWANKPYPILSASQQRIILILRTLIKNPPLLLLDEPFQGLDSRNVIKIQDLLNKIAKQTNCTMVFVTHCRNEIPNSFSLELKLDIGEIVHIGEKLD
jgi:molybdate transport system ATP-binding protein